VVNTEERAAFLERRKKGIGGSDAAAVIGFSPYRTALDVYLEKRGEIEPDDLSDNLAVQCGIELEDFVARKYATETGNAVERVPETLVHPVHGFMLANLDGRVIGKPRGVECKTASPIQAKNSDLWGRAGTDEIPQQYLCQVQHYLGVTNLEAFDVPVLFLGAEFRIYTVHRNQAFIDALIDAEAAFWNGVVNGIPPNAQTIADTRRKFPSHVAKTKVEADEYTRELVEEYLSLDEQIKALREVEERKENIAAKIGDFMGTNEVLTIGGVDRLSFKGQSTGKRLPSSFKNAEPDIFAKYAVEGQTRIMRILKEKKS
jgi:putative phage-type endonuclease